MKKLIVLLAAAAMIAGMSGCVCTSPCEKAEKPACCGDACACSAACEASCACCAKPACDKAKKAGEPKKAAAKEVKKVSRKKAAEAATP